MPPPCGTPLARLTDAACSAGVHAWHCGACSGFWMSEESLRAFYRFRAERIARLRADDAACTPRPPDPGVQALVERELAHDAARAIAPLALMAAPAWVAIGATIVEHVWPALARRFGLGDDGSPPAA